jgi:hypothetical protein
MANTATGEPGIVLNKLGYARNSQANRHLTMPLDGTTDDIETDFEILETIGAHIDGMIEKLISGGALQKTLRRWLNGHAEPPEDADAQQCLMAMAADLELFTPSMSGRTMVDRHLHAWAPGTFEERLAFQALGAAQFRLVRIIDREGPDLIRLKDLVTGESLLLLDARISPLATGQPTAMRLCPLASGRHVVISPLFAMDEAMLDVALTFVRPGRPLGHGHRCAARLYRDVARGGFCPLPQLTVALDEDALLDFVQAVEERLTPIERLALRWIGGGEADADLVIEARRLASVDNLVDAFGCFGQIGADGPQDLRKAYEQIAALQLETIAQRARAGLGGGDTLDLVAAELAGHIARGNMEAGARDLFDRLGSRWVLSGAEMPAANASSATADIDRVIQRIRALRAKTIDRGCTEAEAMAAATKVSELLDRHDLTLDEVSVRRSDCEGVSVATGRKRRAPVDSCMPSIAAFCDCRVWSEEGDDGGLRFVFFGLKADVEAARFLRDLIEVTFDTESTAFRRGEIYQALRGGDRRIALNSFQIGLAGGISGKLAALKAARQSAGAGSSGFDLVAVKHSVVDEEIDRLGLHFVSRRGKSGRYVHGEAYDAGKAAGYLFDPNAALLG